MDKFQPEFTAVAEVLPQFLEYGELKHDQG